MSVSFTTSVDNNCLLSYALATNPDPLQVSPLQGNPSIAALTIVVSNGTTDAIYCNQITFSFDIGPLAQNLTNVSSGILVAASPSDQWKIASTDAGVFVAIPAQPQYNQITTNGLVFQIYNIQVNQQVGTFAFNVDENSSLDKSNFEDRSNVYNVAKFPYGFFVGNFTANKAQVNNGETAVLTWIGSDLAKYTIIYDSQPPVDVTNVRSWTTPPLNHDTNFILTASVQSQGETVNDYLSTVVTVANPILNATSLTVLQTSALQGNTTIGTAAANVNLAVNGTLTSSGKATLNSLTSSGNANVGGTFDVSGNSSLKNVTTGTISTGNATVNGTFNVSQTSSLADTIIRGTLSSNGAVGLIGNAQSISAGNFVAKTDGFVIGYIGYGGSNSNSRSVGWIYGSTAGYTVQVTGGNNVYWLSIGTWSSSWNTSGMPSSFILPVKKGNSCSANLQLPGNNSNEVNPSASFYWVPFGVGNLADTLEKTADLEPEYIKVPSNTTNESKRDERDITEFVNELEELVQNPGHSQIRGRLIETLKKLLSNSKAEHF